MKTWTIACPKDTKFLAGKFYRSYGEGFDSKGGVTLNNADTISGVLPMIYIAE